MPILDEPPPTHVVLLSDGPARNCEDVDTIPFGTTTHPEAVVSGGRCAPVRPARLRPGTAAGALVLAQGAPDPILPITNGRRGGPEGTR